MTREIVLPDQRIVLVDDEDYEWLSKFRWYKGGNRNQYVVTEIKGKRKQIHRLIMGEPAGMDVDHANHNPLDNRRSNLRIASRSQNQANRGSVPNTSSRFKGVCWLKHRSTWQAKICVNRQRFYLGTYSNEIEAAKAYDAAARHYYGEFALTNFESAT